ncbi:MAG: cellulase family glycosylhydrolase [Firmicutes bacterium]|nr:cellulase family glycosylhydrolase [Bacillota bacterium]
MTKRKKRVIALVLSFIMVFTAVLPMRLAMAESGTLSFSIFNNGEGGTPSTPNASLAATGTIRMWTQLNGVNAPIYIAAADTIVALDQNGNNAIYFVRVNRVWEAGTGWLDYFTSIDVDKNEPWQHINLQITAHGHTAHVLLVNALFEGTKPPVLTFDIFNNGEGGSPSRPNAGLAAAGIIRMWTQLDGIAAPIYYAASDTITALDQNGNCAMEYIIVTRMWQTGQGWLPYFNRIDVNKNAQWRYINFSITAYGQRVELLLVNANYVPPSTYHTVTFTVQPGAPGVYLAPGITTTVEVPHGAAIPEADIPNAEARAGFYFVGWYPSSPAEHGNVYGDLSFIARFSELWHYVVFEAGHGGELKPATGFGLTVRIRDGFTFWPDRVPVPVADGIYEFIGWVIDGEEEFVDPAGFVVRNNITFVAVFEQPTPLQQALNAANAALRETVVSNFARRVINTKFFVSEYQMNALVTAIAIAESLSEEDADAGAIELNNALQIFLAARNRGESHGMRENFDGFDFVAEMGVGWNLGNALDSGGFAYGSDRNLAGLCETSWGSPIITRSMIDYVVDAGFGNVRIPITWQNHIGPGPEYRITDVRMDRVEQLVNYVLERDAIAMINMHHDTWKNLSNVTGPGQNDVLPWTPEQEAAIQAQITAVWTQIAERFRDYDDRLIFNVFNEPREYGAFNQWWGGSVQAREVLNQRNQLVVDLIRETGGNNAYRFISVPTYAAGTNPTSMGSFRRPNDPTDPDYEMRRIILQVHAYEPGGLSVGENNWTAARGNSVRNIFYGNNRVRDTAVREGRPGATNENFRTHAMPVIMGEFAWINNNNLVSRAIHSQYYVYFFASYGIASIWWDGNNTAPNTHESTGLLIRDAANPRWAFPTIVEALMNGIQGYSGLDERNIVPGLQIDPQERTLRIGVSNTVQLRHYVFPLNGSQEISSWVSSDTNVATVNANGLVTAQGAGTATITGTSAAGGHQGTVTIHVRPDTTTRYNRMFDFDSDGLDGIVLGDTDSTIFDLSVAWLGEGWNSNVMQIHNISPTRPEDIANVRESGVFGWTSLSVRIPAENWPLIRRSNYVSFDFLIRADDVAGGFGHNQLVLQTGARFPGDDHWMGWWDTRNDISGNSFQTITIDGVEFLHVTRQFPIGSHVQFLLNTSATLHLNFIVQGFRYGADIFIDNITFTTGRTIPESPDIPETDVAVTAVEVYACPYRTHMAGGVLHIAAGASMPLFARTTPEDATNQYVYFWQPSNYANSGALFVNRVTGVVTGVTTGSTIHNVTTRSANMDILSSPLPVVVTYAITGLTLPIESLTMETGEIYTLPAPVVTFAGGGTGINTVFWTSSDETIATVDRYGNVTTINEGTVIITAASRVDWRQYATITITVHAP